MYLEDSSNKYVQSMSDVTYFGVNTGMHNDFIQNSQRLPRVGTDKAD